MIRLAARVRGTIQLLLESESQLSQRLQPRKLHFVIAASVGMNIRQVFSGRVGVEVGRA